MSSCSQSYLDGVFDPAATILCGSDAVMDPVTGRIITPLPHNIAQLLTSLHLNYNHSICCQRCWCFVIVVLVIIVLVIVVVIVIPSLFVFNYFQPWKRGLPLAFIHVLLCPLGMKGTNPHLLWQSH
jgi:hypothetical protein